MAKSKSPRLGDVSAWAEEFNRDLLANAFDGDQYVFVATEEGYTSITPYAFVVRYHDWLVVFAEHHVAKIFHKEDVTTIYEYRITRHESDIPDHDGFSLPRRKK